MQRFLVWRFLLLTIPLRTVMSGFRIFCHSPHIHCSPIKNLIKNRRGSDNNNNNNSRDCNLNGTCLTITYSDVRSLIYLLLKNCELTDLELELFLFLILSKKTYSTKTQQYNNKESTHVDRVLDTHKFRWDRELCGSTSIHLLSIVIPPEL